MRVILFGFCVIDLSGGSNLSIQDANVMIVFKPAFRGRS